MARYIDENKIKFTGLTFEDADKEVYVSLSDVRQAIAQTPTADVVEVKHGHWIAHYNGSFKAIYRCSVCNERLIGYADPSKVPYCHCGAKMDGTPKERGGEK